MPLYPYLVLAKCNFKLFSINMIFKCVVIRCLQGENDVQTEADRRVQHCILASLNKLFPNVTVIAEEVNYSVASNIFPFSRSIDVN